MTSFEDLPIRSDLQGKSPYGAPQIDVPTPLNVNENSYDVPTVIVEDILEHLRSVLPHVNRYPDREFTELRKGLATYVGGDVHPEQVWAANGSNEILQQILLAFGGPGRSVLGYMPTYSMHPIIADLTGTRWIAGKRDESFQLSRESAVAQIKEHQPDIVFLCSPNNPTGEALGLDVIQDVYDATDGIVVVDEAYIEFRRSGTPTAVDLLPGRERLIVSRTLSKAFAFAGVRVGYLVADPAVADALRLVRLPYHLSALTQTAATVSLTYAETLLDSVDTIREQRDRIVDEVIKLGLKPYPSDANFVLINGFDDPRKTWEDLLGGGVLIRDVGIPGHLRVTAGTPQETTQFLELLAASLRAQGQI